MADFVLWVFIVFWTIGGAVHYAWCDIEGVEAAPGKEYVLAFVQGPLIWLCKALEALYRAFMSIVGFPVRAFNKWIQKRD